jgi:GDPmannose 4,6-dehydratase
MKPKALIFGVTGQDGSYLAEILLEKNYEVHGVYRKSSTGNLRNIEGLISNPGIFNKTFFLHKGDLLDEINIHKIISSIRPDEIYNEADQDHVGWSMEIPSFSYDLTASSVGKLLEIIKNIDKGIKFFQPCTSNMFGVTEVCPQNELTPFNPRSPYAVSKTFAYYITRFYREVYGMHASTAIFYNHESPRRTPEYVSRKITQSVARIITGKQEKLDLGDIDAVIDWGYAKEYMYAAWQIVQQNNPDDYVIATGEAHTVREFMQEAFSYVQLDPSKYVFQNPELFRKGKTSTLIGDISKAKKAFGFQINTKFKDLVRIMVDHDLKNEGFKF